MKKQSENDFRSKFRLLSSQENSEEIIWSCSDSSDYEYTTENGNLGKTNTTVNRKRKRGKTRKKTTKNISNLDITFVDGPLEDKNEKNNERSPVMQNKLKIAMSPILASSQHIAPRNHKNILSGSPILSAKSLSCYKPVTSIKSPILVSNHASPKISPNVRKKLFCNKNDEVLTLSELRRISPVFNFRQINKTSKPDSCTFNNSAMKLGIDSKQEVIQSDSIIPKASLCNEYSKQSKCLYTENALHNNEVAVEDYNENDVIETNKTSTVLIEKVKSYFDNCFSSETPSQQSISEYDTTPKNSSKTSEEIELVNSLTDTKHVPKVIKLETRSSTDSLRSYENEFHFAKSKKIRYKKNGLAHRLSVLVKKQKANTSLWQHERFLAANSNFVLPNDDFTTFRIQNVTLKYGCYLLDVVDVENKKYIVLINYTHNMCGNLEQVNIFKLYRPYRILEFDTNCQLILNVSKFECT